MSASKGNTLAIRVTNENGLTGELEIKRAQGRATLRGKRKHGGVGWIP